jgi:small GTP-binding protein
MESRPRASFSFDVFLSHSSKDKPLVRRIAERLKADGVRVWLDEWEIRAGDSIPAKVEEGLEHSRVLVLCMSENAFGSDWAQLEAGTFRFRDPLNKERRFIPLRLDDTPARGSLAQFLHIDWRADRREQEYAKLVEACRSPRLIALEMVKSGKPFLARTMSLGSAERITSVAFTKDGRRAIASGDDNILRFWDAESGRSLRVFLINADGSWSIAWGPDGRRAVSPFDAEAVWLWDADSGNSLNALIGDFRGIVTIVFSPDGRHALSATDENTIRLWDAESGETLRVLKGHSDVVTCVAWSRDGRRALSGSEDETVRLWDIESGSCIRAFHGHRATVTSVAESPDGSWVLSGAHDNCAHIWERESGRLARILMGHGDSVSCVAWSPDSRYALTGSIDTTLRIWNAQTGDCERELEGHTESVLSVDWSPDGRRLLSGSSDNTVRLWSVETGADLRLLEGHVDLVSAVTASADLRLAVSSSRDANLRVWDLQEGRCLRALEGSAERMACVALSPDGRYVLSGAEDGTLRISETETGRCLHTLKGVFAMCLAWSPDGRVGISGSADHTIQMWDVHAGTCIRVIKGRNAAIRSVVASSDGTRILSADTTGKLRLWDVESGRCLRLLEGHAEVVWSVDLSHDGRLALSGSSDETVRVWELDTERCLHVLEGHVSSVDYVALNSDGRHALSASGGGTVLLWNIESGECLQMLFDQGTGICGIGWAADGRRAFAATDDGCLYIWDLGEEISARAGSPPAERRVQYTNAKVLLVGESGAGKTGLSMRLALQDWKPSDSTVGAWATQWKLPLAPTGNIEREIWLWDFGGQADQRLIHQLYMDETAVAVLVFDGQKDNVFDTLGQWDRDLTRASRKVFTKLLAAGRVDAGGLRVSRAEVDRFAKEKGFTGRLFETSAKTGADCESLREAIQTGIDWDNLPWRSSPLLFKRLKEEVVKLKDEGRVLMRFNELRDALRLRLSGTGTEFKDDELKAVVGLLGGPGVVWELSFGNWVLLQPERINAYAQAVIQTLRADEFERGCLSEERVLRGELTYQSSAQRLDGDEERFVLLAMHQTLIERGLCLREQTESGPMLIFPSYYRRERPERLGNPAVLVSYRFNGFLDDIYATLVVRLHHTKPFQHHQLWRHAADFKTLTGKTLGLSLTRRFDGLGELEVYFDSAIAMEEKIIFSRYIHEHLLQKAENVVRLRHYVCPHCGTPVGNREIAMDRLGKWLAGGGAGPPPKASTKTGPAAAPLPTILCQQCEDRVPLWDDLEKCFASPEIERRVQELQRQTELVLDNESKERALVGEVISTVALAGQICRELTVSDHGIDMEIEFKDDAGEATGRKLYLQLKSGDSHLRKKKDGSQVFAIRTSGTRVTGWPRKRRFFWSCARRPVGFPGWKCGIG